MNNKGFTLIELLAVIVVLSIITGISFVLLSDSFSKTKEKTENVFIDTIRDAMDMYLSSDAVDESFSVVMKNGKKCYLKKTYGNSQNQYNNILVYEANITMNDIINSSFHPLTQEDLVNPANEDVSCANASDISIKIYKDEDLVYYYSIDKSEFNKQGEDVFFKYTEGDTINNLPGEFVCE